MNSDGNVEIKFVDTHGKPTASKPSPDDGGVAGSQDIELPTGYEELTPPLPPDGGWGWAVVAASFVANLILDGVCYTFGIIMPELLKHFEAGKGKTALVGSMLPGCYLLVGPIVSALANTFGCRIVSIIGSIIAGVFFALSQFSPNIDVMILTYGVMGGIGFGFMYLPSIVIVGFYFDKKRALATGIAVCGSGIGTFVLAPIVNYLVMEYGWKGANLITGAIIFNGIACGMIYLPLTATKRTVYTATDGSQEANNQQSVIFKKIAEEKQRQRTISTGSMDGTVITKDNRVVKGELSDSVPNSFHVIRELSIENDSNPKTNETTQMLVKSSDRPTTSMTSLEHKQLARVRATDSCAQSTGSFVGSKSSIGHRTAEEEKRLKEQLSSPFARQDIFYTGSITQLPEYTASGDMVTYVQSHTVIPGSDGRDGSIVSKSLSSEIISIVLKMFDFTLLMSPSYLILCIGGILPFLGLYTPFVFVYEKAVNELGVSTNRASLILSILGVFNTIGRLMAGWLADRSWTDSLIIYNVAAICAGILTCLVSVIYSFTLLCVYAALFGIFIAAFIALRSIVIVDLLGIEKLTNAFGLTALFQGVVALVGSPISGAILDATDSFVGPFLVSGCLMIAGGLICLPARLVARWEKNWNESR